MKRLGIALALVAGASTHALAAADTHYAWQGFLTVTANTPACAGVGGTNVGDSYVSIFRAGLTATDRTWVSIIYPRASINFQNDSESSNKQFSGAGNMTVRAVNNKAKPFLYTTTYASGATSPFPVVAATQNVSFSGIFNDMWNTPGCNITFQATYEKQL